MKLKTIKRVRPGMTKRKAIFIIILLSTLIPWITVLIGVFLTK